MSLDPRQVLLAPVVSEKSYSLIEDNKYSFKVHSKAHKTQIRQAVEELFDVTVLGVNVVTVQVEAEAARLPPRHAAGLEEGDRPAPRGRQDRHLRRRRGRSKAADGASQVQADEPRPALPHGLGLRGDHEVDPREEPARARSRRPAGATGTAASPRGTRAAGTSAATASSTSSASRTACRRRSLRSSTTRTGRPASRCCTTRTAPRPTSSPRRGSRSVRRSSRARAPTSSRATRSRSSNIPTGTLVHNVELKPGRGGQLARSAGSGIQLVAKDETYAVLRLPSGEMRRVPLTCRATVGQVGNVDHENIRAARRGAAAGSASARPSAGSAMNPVDHPHGGGEGKSKGGRHPVTPWGVPTLGKRTRKKHKESDRLIVRGRRRGKKRR